MLMGIIGRDFRFLEKEHAHLQTIIRHMLNFKTIRLTCRVMSCAHKNLNVNPKPRTTHYALRTKHYRMLQSFKTSSEKNAYNDLILWVDNLLYIKFYMFFKVG